MWAPMWVVSGNSRDGARFIYTNKHGGEKINGTQERISQELFIKIM